MFFIDKYKSGAQMSSAFVCIQVIIGNQINVIPPIQTAGFLTRLFVLALLNGLVTLGQNPY
jgi:hypothetical protein